MAECFLGLREDGLELSVGVGVFEDFAGNVGAAEGLAGVGGGEGEADEFLDECGLLCRSLGVRVFVLGLGVGFALGG